MEDNYPTTNLKALACGTPVKTYNTGGSPECIDENVGVVEKGNIRLLANVLKKIESRGKDFYSSLARRKAEILFSAKDKYYEYVELFQKLKMIFIIYT